MKLEEAVVLGDEKRAWTGSILGFIIACCFLGVNTKLVLAGLDVAGGLLAGGGLVSLVSVFVYGTNKRSQERAEQLKALLADRSRDD